MSEPTFIEEIEPEAILRVVITLRNTTQFLQVGMTATEAATLMAHFTTRDMSVPCTTIVQTVVGLLCLDLDAIAAINAEPTRARQVKSLLQKVEELSI